MAVSEREISQVSIFHDSLALHQEGADLQKNGRRHGWSWARDETKPFLVVAHSTADKGWRVERQIPATCFWWRCFYGDSPTDYLRGFLDTVAVFAHAASFSVRPRQMVLGSAHLSPALVTTTGALQNLFLSVSPKQ